MGVVKENGGHRSVKAPIAAAAAFPNVQGAERRKTAPAGAVAVFFGAGGIRKRGTAPTRASTLAQAPWAGARCSKNRLAANSARAGAVVALLGEEVAEAWGIAQDEHLRERWCSHRHHRGVHRRPSEIGRRTLIATRRRKTRPRHAPSFSRLVAAPEPLATSTAIIFVRHALYLKYLL